MRIEAIICASCRYLNRALCSGARGFGAALLFARLCTYLRGIKSFRKIISL